LGRRLAQQSGIGIAMQHVPIVEANAIRNIGQKKVNALVVQVCNMIQTITQSDFIQIITVHFSKPLSDFAKLNIMTVC
jgi:desulfoferrodoxin (superoxide reductase-like protein)